EIGLDDLLKSLPTLIFYDSRNPYDIPSLIGVGLVGFGLFFILFGVLLYFDSVLLAFGNLLFLSGLAIIIGLRRTFSFFFQKEKLKGTSFFLGGILIVLLRWPLLGMLLETYVLAFSNSFARVTVFGFLGALGNIPLLSKVSRALGLDFMESRGLWFWRKIP
uniref:Vesicle transport protein GOT1A n=1 Tax=Chelydra serpentina TaxID=8475 RepID=A0A8C3XJ93_CHESE